MATKEKIAVMQAYEDGKQIQFFKNNNGWKDWAKFSEPIWNWEDCDYRIKPEEVKHKYKVGDYVLVLDGSAIPDYTGGWEMGEYTGRIFEVEALEIEEGKPCYCLKGDEASSFTFDERGLALVKIGE